MDEILAFIIGQIELNTTLTETLVIGQLDEGNSLTIQLAPSSTDSEFFNRERTIDVSMLVLSKNINQLTAIQNLDNILSFVASQRTYPQPTSGNFQWMTGEITTHPMFVDKQENQHYIYSAIINNKIFK